MGWLYKWPATLQFGSRAWWRRVGHKIESCKFPFPTRHKCWSRAWFLADSQPVWSQWLSDSPRRRCLWPKSELGRVRSYTIRWVGWTIITYTITSEGVSFPKNRWWHGRCDVRINRDSIGHYTLAQTEAKGRHKDGSAALHDDNLVLSRKESLVVIFLESQYRLNNECMLLL